MADAIDFAAGGSRFIPAVFQYSGGAAALPGHNIRRVRFRSTWRSHCARDTTRSR